MIALRTQRMPHKTNHLPAGISCTWRKKPGTDRRPYFEFQAHWIDHRGRPKTKHFHVGVEPTSIRLRLALLRAIAFRRAFELSYPIRTRKGLAA